MAEITFTVRNDLAERILDGFKGHYSIPTDPEGIPLYTDAQWFKKCIINHVRYVVLKHERNLLVRAAQQDITLDNDAIT